VILSCTTFIVWYFMFFCKHVRLSYITLTYLFTYVSLMARTIRVTRHRNMYKLSAIPICDQPALYMATHAVRDSFKNSEYTNAMEKVYRFLSKCQR